MANLKSAMRVAIQKQVNAFRSLNVTKTSVCEICGNVIEGSDALHVDYVVQFDSLVDDFLMLNPCLPTVFDDEDTTHRAMFKSIDWQFEESWYEFHEINSRLRLVHSGCNLSRSKQGV